MISLIVIDIYGYILFYMQGSFRLNKIYQYSHSSNGGFGLIEFVIVIAIIILLTLLLIVVNPKEQIDRSRDLSKIMAAETLYSTFIRSEANQTFPLQQAYSGSDLTSLEGQAILDKLVKSLEIQSAFSERKELSDMHLSYDPQTKIMRLCFKLISKMYQSEYVVEYDQAGNFQSDCTPETCYTCLFEEKPYQGKSADGVESSPGVQASFVPTPTPTPAPVATGWKRADQTNNCVEYCATQGLSCSDIPLSCPSYCGSTSGYAQIEATWAGWYNSPRDPISNETCWAHGSCATEFRYKPLWAYNARCCCQ